MGDRMRIAVRSRVILDNDWSGDPDGLVALTHHLLSPANAVLAITSTFLHPMFDSPQSRATDGARLAAELVELIGAGAPPVFAGAERPFEPGLHSPAADAIIELVRAAETPVTVACGGPLTNIALALQAAPDLAERMSLVWVGGALDAHDDEYNRDTDPEALDIVFGTEGLQITQFPLEVYRECLVTLAQLECEFGDGGVVGAWLWRQFTGLHLPDFIELGETWALGDSLPVLVTALDGTTCSFSPSDESVQAEVRVCTGFDPHLLLADWRAKLRLQAQSAR